VRFPGFIGPSYTAASLNVDCQRTVNLYPEVNDLGTGKDQEVASLVPTPGLRLLVTLPESPVRGVWRASNDEFYAVGGDKLYQVSDAWVATEIGALQTSEGPVSIADNGLHLVVVDGTYGYVWTFASDTFSEITDEDFLGADQVTFQDGYFIFNKPASQQFFISDLNTVDFAALDIATAEGSPDNLVGLVSSHQNLYLFGTQSTEVFYNSGDADFPFARIQGAIMETGCMAPFSIAKLGGAVYWIGRDETGYGILYRANGFKAERVSTTVIESQIKAVDPDEIGNARAWTYQEGGHAFYCLNLPGAESTWVFDASTGLWHERAYRNLWDLERHRADCHAVAHGQHVVGDYESGNLYALDSEVYTDNGAPIVRMRTAPHVSKNMSNIFHLRFQLDMETGVGLDGEGQGSSPKAMLQWSDDGGHTWSNEQWADIGGIGEKKKRVIWRRLGRARDRVYRVAISDPVKVVLIGADIQLEEGMS
jgi:hypothetical protein